MNNPLIYLWRKLWHYSGHNKRKVVTYTGLFMVANIIDSLEPLIVALILNTVQTQGIGSDNLSHLLWLLLLLPLKELLFWAFHGVARIMENRNAFIVRANYKNYLLQGTMALPIEWHTDHHSGDTIDKIEKGTTALFTFTENTFLIFQSIILLVTALIVLLSYDLIAGGLVFLLIIPTFLILIWFDRHLVPGYKIVNSLENKITAKVFDSLSNITTIIILRVETLVLATMNKYIQKPYTQYNNNIKLNEWKWFSASMLGRLAVLIAVGLFLILHAAEGAIMVGTIYILYGYANQIRESFFRFAYLYNDIIRQRTSVANAEELSRDFIATSKKINRHLPKKWSKLEIKDLSFSYHVDDTADLHLDGINLALRPGERTALIGDSGGGKSTMLKVIRGLYHPRSFSLLVDDKPVKGGFAAISDSISLIPQDPEIFSTTIRENITLGVDYSAAHVKKFTDLARFTSVVKRLPKGLESSIMEKGVNLSGGEKQRLALARGLLASADKEIILLDEPTSSVDFNNELEIYQQLFATFKQKTIISSIHRLHLLSLFDSVYFFKDGKIIAAGSFEELKQTSIDFQDLWERYLKTRDAVTA